MPKTARLPPRTVTPPPASLERRCASLTGLPSTQTAPPHRGAPHTGVWPPDDLPLIVIELPCAEFPTLRPGFGRWDDDDAFTFNRHPSAGLRLRDQMAQLWLDDRTFAPVPVPSWWYTATSAVLAVIPSDGGLPADYPLTDRFQAAVNRHLALLAEIGIDVETP